MALERFAVAAGPDVSSERVAANGVDGEWISACGAAHDRAVLYLHGGGYVAGSVNTHRDLMGRVSRSAKAVVLGLNYRLAPEHPFPAALEDSIAGYLHLLREGFRPSAIAVVGDSAGGGLAVAAMVAAREARLPLPGAAVCLSPWVDLEAKGRSMITRASIDPIASRETVLALARMYLGAADPRTPAASPLHAELKDLPPMLIQVGDAETLLDDSIRLARRGIAAGVKVRLEVWPDMMHVWHRWAGVLPAAQAALEAVGGFIRQHTG